jgi:dTDP-4-dehydrorhamnose 3,5-epimerase
MQFLPTAIPDILLIEPTFFGDDRGFFMETYQAQQFYEAGIDIDFVQDNHSGSRRGILRGLHYQIRHTQGKLIRVISGEIYDVAVDLRRSSICFGQWISFSLSSNNKHQVWIPPGFAHGFYVLSEWAEVVYNVSDYYSPEWERTLLWNDPELGIEWPLLNGEYPILSEKDARGTPLREAELFE